MILTTRIARPTPTMRNNFIAKEAVDQALRGVHHEKMQASSAIIPGLLMTDPGAAVIRLVMIHTTSEIAVGPERGEIFILMIPGSDRHLRLPPPLPLLPPLLATHTNRQEFWIKACSRRSSKVVALGLEVLRAVLMTQFQLRFLQVCAFHFVAVTKQ